MAYRYFIHLAYKGTNYHGWQVQPNSVTIQEIVNKAFSTILNEAVETTGAGRTDTGVHATSFYAHFDCSKSNLDKDKTAKFKINCILPPDIVVYKIIAVPPEAHARFDATSRTYLYRVSLNKDPFNQDLSMFYSKPLDIGLMNQAAEILKDYTDFTSFSKLHTDVKTNNCKILYARWEKNGNELQFTISADRFLRNMVRAIVGTMIKIGENKLSIHQFREIIEQKDRSKAGASISPKGLHLIKIEYPPHFFIQ